MCGAHPNTQQFRPTIQPIQSYLASANPSNLENHQYDPQNLRINILHTKFRINSIKHRSDSCPDILTRAANLPNRFTVILRLGEDKRALENIIIQWKYTAGTARKHCRSGTHSLVVDEERLHTKPGPEVLSMIERRVGPVDGLQVPPRTAESQWALTYP